MSAARQDLVLLVEDNDIDAMMLERVLGRLRPEVGLLRAEDGEVALDVLETRRPDLIVMDIRMPRMDGREALERIKGDERLRGIPVVMMSTSRNDEDVAFCYRNHANAYVVKPVDAREGRGKLEELLRFWLDTVEL